MIRNNAESFGTRLGFGLLAASLAFQVYVGLTGPEYKRKFDCPYSIDDIASFGNPSTEKVYRVSGTLDGDFKVREIKEPCRASSFTEDLAR